MTSAGPLTEQERSCREYLWKAELDPESLRSQSSCLEAGIGYSSQYLPVMENIFKERELPVELTRLPFVESSFNVEAFSKAGASGIWQFMPATGSQLMKVGDRVDERHLAPLSRHLLLGCRRLFPDDATSG